MSHNPALQGMIDEARAVTCEEWLTREGLIGSGKGSIRKSGHNLTGPCPSCGGDDRFGVNTADDKWLCRHCGIGGNDAISMVILLDRWPLKGKTYGECFIEACEVITGRKRTEVMSEAEAADRAAELAKKKAKQVEEGERRRQESIASARKLWDRTSPAGETIARYLVARGIECDVSRLVTVHQLDTLDYWHDLAPAGSKRPDMQVIHKGPAMVAVILDSAGKFCGVHRTWLDANGKKGKAVIVKPGPEPEALDSKKVLGSMADGAIRLVTPRDAAGNITATRMVVGEGIETTLTPYVAEGRADTAYWCAITMGHMAGRAGKDADTGRRDEAEPDMADTKCFLVPEWVKELVLLGDGDSDAAKTKAAMTRAAKRAKRLHPGIKVRIAWPGIRGDFNDLAMEEGKTDD